MLQMAFNSRLVRFNISSYRLLNNKGHSSFHTFHFSFSKEFQKSQVPQELRKLLNAKVVFGSSIEKRFYEFLCIKCIFKKS